MFKFINNLLTKKSKLPIGFLAFLCFYISSGIETFAGAKIGTHFVNNQLSNSQHMNSQVYSMIGKTVFVISAVTPLFLIILFIIVIGIFYFILKIIFRNKEFSKQISFKNFLKLSEFMYIIKAITTVILIVIIINISNLYSMNLIKAANQWKVYLSRISIAATLVFLIFLFSYLRKYVLGKSKKALIAFFIPYAVYLSISSVIPFLIHK